jgi:sugar O-acyltransferase (sialic acid O-acetyltransferase NeuD family)
MNPAIYHTNSRPKCVIFGAGGHAKVVIDCILASESAEPTAILDINSNLWGTDLLGIKILGGEEIIERVRDSGVSAFIVGVGTLGRSSVRSRLFELGKRYGLKPLTAKHPAAVCSRFAEIGEGTVLFAGSVINPAAVVGVNVIINTGSIVEHDCVIGDHAHIATGAKLAGNVTVGDSAMIGAGAVVKQGLVIGAKAVIGAGAVVIEDVLPGQAVAGVPARRLR